jgi:ABC-type nitrate/sulfonate/bicarbonate transport system substrate-binding protein
LAITPATAVRFQQNLPPFQPYKPPRPRRFPIWSVYSQSREITNRQGSTSTAAITKVPVATANPDLEVKTVSLGYIPILEAAPLVVGVEKGFFARHGLEVNLSKQSSWGAARDNLVLGAAGGGIDGGQ